MDATPPAAANPADKILDNLDAFAGVVVAVLVSGVFPLSSNQNRQLLQAQTALKGSTDEIRKLLAGMEDEDFIPEGMFSGYDAARLSSENELRAKDQALLADLLAEQSGPEIVSLPLEFESTDFGRQLLALDGVAALKSLLALTVDDIDGLAKTLKALKAKSAAREVPAPSEDAPAADPPADPPADPLAAEPAAAPTPEA